ncbi:MAG: hypothetical protein DMG21_07165 [Acidobacteria bacterium]|nr:MAG: hypothetical protein DMG21_07165 [Acidobacteriota bacterium]
MPFLRMIIGYHPESVNSQEAWVSPVGHLQYGWWFAHWRNFDRRERAAIALAGAACDLDGVSLFWGGDAYYRYHHILFHNVGSLLAITAIAGLFFWRRPWAWLLVAFSFGMHVVEDYFTVPWDMQPWRPFANTVVNFGQHVPGWVVQYVFQSVAMVGIVGVTAWIYSRHKRTPLEIISPALERLILNYAVLPWKHRCSSCAAKAHFRCDNCGRPFCAKHVRANRRCQVRCAECAP